MDALLVTGLGVTILAALVFGVFLVTKRQETAIDLQKETVELLKKVEENTKGN